MTKVQHFAREWRAFRGYSVRALSLRCGLSQSLISQFENGKTKYHQNTLEELARGLDCEPWQLLCHGPDKAVRVKGLETEIKGLKDEITGLKDAISKMMALGEAAVSDKRSQPDPEAERVDPAKPERGPLYITIDRFMEMLGYKSRVTYYNRVNTDPRWPQRRYPHGKGSRPLLLDAECKAYIDWLSRESAATEEARKLRKVKLPKAPLVSRKKRQGRPVKVPARFAPDGTGPRKKT